MVSVELRKRDSTRGPRVEEDASSLVGGGGGDGGGGREGICWRRVERGAFSLSEAAGR